jgi:hypothetical protein
MGLTTFPTRVAWSRKKPKGSPCPAPFETNLAAGLPRGYNEGLPVRFDFTY